jgi:DNA-binding CsgD family transcriptional regulator
MLAPGRVDVTGVIKFWRLLEDLLFLNMEDLIDRIYECAFAPHLWPSLCDELATLSDARGGFLFTANVDVVAWTASESLRGGMERFVGGGYFTRSQRASRAIAARHAGFLREHDLYTDDELKQDAVYRDLLLPAGLGWAAATVVTAPTGDVLFLSLERDYAKGPMESETVQRLDSLRPHLARSALMAARLQLERARIAGQTLDALGLPALVFDSRGKVLAATPKIEALADHVCWAAADRVSLTDRLADAQFRQAIETLDVDGVRHPLSFAIRAADTSAGMVAHVIPLRRTARDLFAQCAGVLVISPVTLPKAPPVELVQSLFDLTPAEARVARHLTTGQTVEEIAAGAGVSLTTVRSQVRGVLEKTGSRRQVEAIALLGGIAGPWG